MIRVWILTTVLGALAATGCENRTYDVRADPIDCDAADPASILGTPCGAGVCAGGVRECTSGNKIVCSTEPGGSDARSGIEVCDGLDNDCNSFVDDAVPTPELCDGIDNDCDRQVDEGFPAPEICDGIDDDCDGLVDEGFPTPEICDGLDNDCNDLVDDGLPPGCLCDNPATRACDGGLGPETGSQSCEAGAPWGPCVLNWAKRTRLTLNNGGLGETLADVPILVALAEPAVSYADMAADGADIAFVGQDLHTLLPFEIETWDPSGVSLVWVRVPVIEPAPAVSAVWLYHQNPVPPAPPAATEVWSSSYAAVLHLDEEVAGTGTGGGYRDSTAHGNHGTDLNRQPRTLATTGFAQRFAATDRIEIPWAASLAAPTGLTLELTIDVIGSFWPRRAAIALAGRTGVAAQPAELQLSTAAIDRTVAAAAGAGLQIRTPSGTRLDHWIEAWQPTTTSHVWVRLPTTTAALVARYGNLADNAPGQTAAAFLDGPGLWLTTSHNTLTTAGCPTTLTQMNAHFGGQDLGGTHGAGGGYGINCVDGSDCDPFSASNDQNYYTALFEGWLTLTADGSYTFGTDSDDGSDVFVGGLKWSPTPATANLVASKYGEDQNSTFIGGDFVGQTTKTYAKGLYRFTYRMFEHLDRDGYQAAWKPPGNAALGVIPSTRYNYLPTPRATGTGGAFERRFVGVEKTGGYAFGASGTRIFGGAAGSETSATVATGVRNLALVFDGVAVRLYVDGTQVASRASSLPPAVGAPVNVGFLAQDDWQELVVVDELRVSGVARSAGWLLIQHRALNRELVTFGWPEPTRP